MLIAADSLKKPERGVDQVKSNKRRTGFLILCVAPATILFFIFMVVPTLNVFRAEGINNFCCVITRYFGGILLGAGGLVRAYAAGAKAAIDAAGIVTYENYTEFKLVSGYSEYQKLEYELPRYHVKVDSTDFGGDVTLKLAIRAVDYESFADRVAELFAGRIKPEITGERFDYE